MYFLVYMVDGPITGRAYKREGGRGGGGRGAYKRQFTVVEQKNIYKEQTKKQKSGSW